MSTVYSWARMTLSQQKGTHGVSIQDIRDNPEAQN